MVLLPCSLLPERLALAREDPWWSGLLGSLCAFKMGRSTGSPLLRNFLLGHLFDPWPLVRGQCEGPEPGLAAPLSCGVVESKEDIDLCLHERNWVRLPSSRGGPADWGRHWPDWTDPTNGSWSPLSLECLPTTAWHISFLRGQVAQRIPGWAFRPLSNVLLGISRKEGYFSELLPSTSINFCVMCPFSSLMRLRFLSANRAVIPTSKTFDCGK